MSNRELTVQVVATIRRSIAYATAFEGPYFAAHLELARQQDPIGRIAADPAVIDIGGAGETTNRSGAFLNKADARIDRFGHFAGLTGACTPANVTQGLTA